MPGPAPKPAAQRRRVNAPLANTVRLPAEGRKGVAPVWPLGDASELESTVWSELWRLPQAVAWERLGWTRTVARYVRAVVLAEESFHPALLAEVRQMEDRVGLSPMAMLRLRWEIVEDEVDGARQAKKPTRDARKRLRAVE